MRAFHEVFAEQAFVAGQMVQLLQTYVDENQADQREIIAEQTSNLEHAGDRLRIMILDQLQQTFVTPTHICQPWLVGELQEMEGQGYREYWITYNNPLFSAKELTAFLGKEVWLQDDGAYGVLVVQGHGQLEGWSVEVPTLVRFTGQTADEFFVSATRAKEGVLVRNKSTIEDLLLLRHYAQAQNVRVE